MKYIKKFEGNINTDILKKYGLNKYIVFAYSDSFYQIFEVTSHNNVEYQLKKIYQFEPNINKKIVKSTPDYYDFELTDILERPVYQSNILKDCFNFVLNINKYNL